MSYNKHNLVQFGAAGPEFEAADTLHTPSSFRLEKPSIN